MEKQSIFFETYESPAMEIVEIVSEGVLCQSGETGIDDLIPGVDF